ncbi:hypothetical protein KIN20_021826, partial [Parelaphostrongylus tenuis]
MPITGVVNPNHCVEEWIDDRVDIIFYERFFIWEIASGNYLVRNTEFGINFLKSWGEFEFTQPILILKAVMLDAWHEAENSDEVWYNATGYETYLKYVSCVKQMLGATRLWPGKVRIYRRAHGWVRDGHLTNDKKELAAFERQQGKRCPFQARPLMYISMPDIGACYPFCDNKTWEIS